MEQFKHLTDTKLMVGLFQDHLPEFSKSNHRVASCTIERAPRPTSSNLPPQDIPSLSVLYKVLGKDLGKKTGWSQRVYGKVFPPGLGNITSDLNQLPLTLQSGTNGKVVHFPSFDLVLWVFPNDPSLGQLPTCLDPNKVKSFLPYGFLPEDVNKPDDLSAVITKVLNYLPEDRCTIRYDLQWGEMVAPGSGIFIGKTFSDTRGMDLFKLMQQVWNRSRQDQEAFMVAPPLVYQETTQTFWQGLLPGTPIPALLNHSNCEEISESIAKGLAHFQKGKLSSIATIHNRGFLTDTLQKTKELMHALPSLQQALQSVFLKIENIPSSLESVSRTPIHGSFRIKEIVAHEGRLGLFDFDNCTFGDPIRDVGVFIADLHRRVLGQELVMSVSNHFLKAYRAHVKWDVSIDAVNWHFRTRLLEKAHWRLENRWFTPNFEKRIHEIVELAEEGIAQHF